MAAATPELTVFLAASRLDHHEKLLVGGGYTAIDDLKDADDTELIELGLKKPEVRRLRRATAAAAKGAGGASAGGGAFPVSMVPLEPEPEPEP
eukprot:SAG22_NODE_17931_length_296_cov_0.781726_1_plen_92_part_01